MISKGVFIQLKCKCVFNFFKGTKKETGDVLTFQNVGLLSAISISNTSLVGGTSYYFSVKGKFTIN